MVVVGAVVLVAAGVGAAWGAGAWSSGSTKPQVVADAVTVVRQGSAAGLAFIGSDGWVASDQSAFVRPFDPATGRFTAAAVPVGHNPVSVASGGGELWVADSVGNAVDVVDPARHVVVGAPISVADEPVSVAYGDGGVWVASIVPNGTGAVTLIDPASRKVIASVSPPDGAVRVALGDGAVWVTGESDALTRIDPTPTGATLTYRAITLGPPGMIPVGVAVTPNAVWVTDAGTGTVSEVDPATDAVVRTVHLQAGSVTGVDSGTGPTTTIAPGQTAPSDPDTVAVAGGGVWVGDGASGTVVELDPRTGLSRGPALHLNGVPRTFVVWRGTLFATTANPGAVVRIVAR